MTNEWLIDVLADLKAFAAKNELSALAQQLDLTAVIAASELAERATGGRTRDKGAWSAHEGASRRPH
ncbi:hypothetical protein DXV76_16225 [Rhodobacteraceae bacterium CCMM004]|nr:hypothetical protein DXV76_16225 [Rhodobacteraceae bacterium CCMM004]